MSSPEPSDVVPVAQSELSGRQLGGYHLLRRLGRGAMAEVYLAEQVSLRRHVALKILKANLALQDSYVKRFRLEAQAAASLVHPNIVQIYEVGCADGLHFIAQEYVQGMNLQELLVRRGAPDLKLALAIMRQAAAALAKAAERGIVHRDIKPENIMLSGHGEVKVADFGLARLSNDETRLTQEGYTLGTPLYMSPEQVEGKPLDTRSDIYSLGVTCYHMLAGQPPFRGETALNVAVQHLKGEAADLGELRPTCRPRFVAWCDGCLRKNRPTVVPMPRRSCASCAALRPAAASMPTPIRTSCRATASSRRPPRAKPLRNCFNPRCDRPRPRRPRTGGGSCWPPVWPRHLPSAWRRAAAATRAAAGAAAELGTGQGQRERGQGAGGERLGKTRNEAKGNHRQRHREEQSL